MDYFEQPSYPKKPSLKKPFLASEDYDYRENQDYDLGVVVHAVKNKRSSQFPEFNIEYVTSIDDFNYNDQLKAKL